MQRPPSLVISQDDFHKITSLLSFAKKEISELLEDELARARVVPEGEVPGDTVRMSSSVAFLDLETGQEQRVTLVFPHEARIDERRISILAPMGVALIGLRVGQEIEWPVNDKKVRRIRVTAVANDERGRP